MRGATPGERLWNATIALVRSDFDPASSSPERELISSIICRAVVDAVADNVTSDIKNKAKRWINSDKNPDTPWTFPWCLAQLELEDATHTLKRIREFCASTSPLWPEQSFRKKVTSVRPAKPKFTSTVRTYKPRPPKSKPSPDHPWNMDYPKKKIA